MVFVLTIIRVAVVIDIVAILNTYILFALHTGYSSYELQPSATGVITKAKKSMGR
jgi:hypothetical protein